MWLGGADWNRSIVHYAFSSICCGAQLKIRQESLSGTLSCRQVGRFHFGADRDHRRIEDEFVVVSIWGGASWSRPARRERVADLWCNQPAWKARRVDRPC